jgi:hypothetical protein
VRSTLTKKEKIMKKLTLTLTLASAIILCIQTLPVEGSKSTDPTIPIDSDMIGEPISNPPYDNEDVFNPFCLGKGDNDKDDNPDTISRNRGGSDEKAIVNANISHNIMYANITS